MHSNLLVLVIYKLFEHWKLHVKTYITFLFDNNDLFQKIRLI